MQHLIDKAFWAILFAIEPTLNRLGLALQQLQWRSLSQLFEPAFALPQGHLWPWGAITNIKRRMNDGQESAETLDVALVHLDELCKQIHLPESNVWREPIDWDGELGIVWIMPNWRSN